MATVDKLTLELEADGINAFIKAMDDAESGLQKVRENIQKTAKENGLMDKELDKSSKKKKVKDKKADKEKNKSTKSFNKNLQDGTKSLDKMLKTLLAISGISFGISGLMSKSEQSAKVGADLANQARNTNVRTEDIETAQTALQAASINKNALDDLIAKLADNQNSMMAGQGGNAEIQNLIAILNGFDRSGNKVDNINTDPIQTIKDMMTLFQSNDETTKRGIISQAKNAGLSSDVINFLTNPKSFKYWEDSSRLAIRNKKKTELDQQDQARLTFSQKNLDNKFTEVSEPFNKVQIALNTLSVTILDKLNPVIKDLANDLSAALRTINGYFNYDNKKLSPSEFDKSFEQFNSKNNKQKFLTTAISALYLSNDDTGKLNNPSWYNKGEIDLSKALEGLNDKIEKLPVIQQNFIKKYDEMIDSIDKDSGIIKFKNGDQYGGGWWDKFLSNLEYPTYLTDHFNDLLKPEYSQQLMQQSFSNQNNSNSQVIQIQEMHINSNATNIKDIINDGFNQSNMIVGNPVTLFNHLGNTK